ncbi:unnamed protein product [Closterium sp. Yama58-4]|nr:unnamed protein product [Closterium sp. Yama58-4]
MPREPREVHHVDEFRRLAAENDSGDVASSRSDDAGDVACDASTTTSDVEADGVRVRTVDFNARRETDYVIVVHGTFDAPPADGARTWYQPPAPGEQNFCAKMGALLARGPIGAGSVWRAIPRPADSQGAESQGPESQGSEVHGSGSQRGQSQGAAASQRAQSQGGAASQRAQSQGGAASQKGGQSWQRVMDGDVPYPFFWDGSNTHEGRVKAAEKLARLFDLIASRDPSARIHVIAHSHGGNVLLKSTELYMKRLPTHCLSPRCIRPSGSVQVDRHSGWRLVLPIPCGHEKLSAAQIYSSAVSILPPGLNPPTRGLNPPSRGLNPPSRGLQPLSRGLNPLSRRHASLTPSVADDPRAVADGQHAVADGQHAVADGQQAVADGQQAVADGQHAATSTPRADAHGQRGAIDDLRASADGQHASGADPHADADGHREATRPSLALTRTADAEPRGRPSR